MKFEKYTRDNLPEISDSLKDEMWQEISPSLKKKTVNKNWKWLASAIILLGISALFYSLYQKSLKIDRLEKMISQIQKKSTAPDKIMQLHTLTSQNAGNVIIQDLLIDRMKNDSSPNVRITAVREISNHMDSQKVRSALLKRLSKEKDEYVLMTIVRIFTDIKLKAALPYLEELTTKNFNTRIKKELERSILIIS